MRWRAHYNPKVVQLEGGDGPDANRKRVNNVFQMLGKVYRVEVNIFALTVAYDH